MTRQIQAFYNLNFPCHFSFDISLPYTSVSYSFTGLRHYWDVQSRLSDWSALRHVPKCWAVIQPLLCAVRALLFEMF